MTRHIDLVQNLPHPKVALVGDFMLDRYLFGDTERISPEAPVPVLRLVGSESRPGGAASVAVSILALGGRVACVGTVGQDPAGDELMGILNSAGAETSALLRLPGRPTTTKQRLVGLAQHRHRQQMLRLDTEELSPLPREVLVTVRGSLRSAMDGCQVVAIEDYDKGLLDETTCPQIIADARARDLPVIVDPARIADYTRYRGATLLTPNRYEAETASGVKIADEAALARAAERILETTGAEAVVITLDKEGAYLARRGQPGVRVPTRPRRVYDVAGAGDAVLAMLAVACGGGCDWPDAVALANVAGGLEVERFGVVPITRAEVLDELRHQIGLRSGKVMDRKRLLEEAARRREGGESIVFTNGCFDLLHMGHVRYLRQARELGSCLVVAINSDASTRRLKGPTRPVIGQDERAEMLAALECVDCVTIFDEDTPVALLEMLRPDWLVKGGSTGEIVGQALVESYGGKVAKMELVGGLSTTEIINRILSTRDAT